MKKSMTKLTLVLVAVLVFVLCIGVMVACNADSHDFSGEWKMDGSNHWKECSCGTKGESAAHIDANSDGICDVCGYNGMHVHSYGDWKTDSANHWKECSCGNKIDFVAHADNDNDEKCDICGYVMHEHSYGEWQSNESNHWKECACGNKSEEGVHADGDGDEICDVCRYNMHVHNYIWVSNSTSHWHLCTGCQGTEVNSTAAHVDDNGDELCDICGYNMHVHSYSWRSDNENHWKECACGGIEADSTEAHVDVDGNGICDVCEHQAIVKVTVKDGKGNGVKDVTVEISGISAKTDANGVASINMFIESETVISWSIESEAEYFSDDYYTSEGVYEYEIVLLNEVTRTFEVYDSATDSYLEGIIVKLMDGTAVVDQATTDSDGQVTFTYPLSRWGQYTFALEGLKEGKSLKSGLYISKISTETDIFTLDVETLDVHTITVKCGEGVEYSLEGIEVTFYGKSSYGQVKYTATATTDANGVVKFNSAKYNNYEVTVALNDGFVAESQKYNQTVTSTYSVTVTIEKDEEGGGGSTSENTLVIGENTINGTLNGIAYTLTADEAGTYTISSEDSHFCILDASYEQIADSSKPYSVYLTAGQSVTINFSTTGLDATYSVTVAYDASGEPPVEVKIPSAFIGTWTDSNNIIYSVSETSIWIDWNDCYTLDDITIVSDTEINVDGMTWTRIRDGRIVITAEDMEPIYLSVKLPTLNEGTNTVDASYNGEAYEFTADVAGTYVISTESNIAYINISTGDEIEGAGSVTITLEKDQTILIYFMIQDENGEDTQYDVDIAQVYPEIEIGTTTVTTDGYGVKYTFTATATGTYTISSSYSDCYVYYVFGYDGDTFYQGGSISVVLQAGDKITIYCGTWISEETCSYAVTISYSETIEGGDQGGDEDPTITFPEDLRDTWYADMNGDIVEIVISEHSIAMGDIDGYGCAIETDETLGTIYVFYAEAQRYFIYLDGADWYLGELQRGNLVSYKLSTEEPGGGEGGGTETPSEKTIGIGTTEVDANFNGIEYKLTATEAGTYTITFTSSNANVGIEDNTGIEWISSGKQIELAQGSSIVIVCATMEEGSTDKYEITISYKAPSNLISKIEGATMSSYEELTENTPDSGDSTEKYYTIGYVKSIDNTTYGNMYIQDDDGNEFYIYGTYGFDGKVRFDSLPVKPEVGDVVVVYGKLTKFNDTVEMKNAWLMQIGTEVQTETDAYKMAQIKVSSSVEADFELSELATWTVKEGTAITIDGTTAKVTRGEEDQTVVLTATIGEVAKDFTVVVAKLPEEGDPAATFTFGNNVSGDEIEHKDGNSVGTSYTESSNGYTLSLTSCANVYDGANDAKGNSALKLGTSKKNGSFTFTVEDDVKKVVIYVAQYKANTTTVSINGTSYSITKSSNDGEYMAIEIDVSETKTISFEATSKRCMIDKIEFYA